MRRDNIGRVEPAARGGGVRAGEAEGVGQPTETGPRVPASGQAWRNRTPQGINMESFTQCSGSGFSENVPGSSILSVSGCGPGSRGLMTKNWKKKKISANFLSFFLSNIEIYLYRGLCTGHPSYRQSLQSSKENIQHFKKWNVLTFSIFVGHFSPPGSGSGFAIRIQGPYWIRIYSRSGYGSRFGSTTLALLLMIILYYRTVPVLWYRVWYYLRFFYAVSIMVRP